MTKHLFLALLAMFLLTLSVAAQNVDEENATNDNKAALENLLIGRFINAALKNDPSGMFMGTLASETFLAEVREEFGITEEQVTQFEMHMRSVNESKEMQEIEKNLEEKFRLEEKFGSGNVDLTETELAEMDFAVNFIYDKANEATAAAFSPEQIQKMDGIILALSGGLESPFLNDRHMTALDMTDEQKKQFAVINEEINDAREKMVAGLTETVISMKKSGKFEFKDLVGALGKFKEFTKELKKRRQAVLTASQISKMKTLSRLPKALSVANLLPKWMPDADSWKPGDPVPEKFKEERKPNRFPRSE